MTERTDQATRIPAHPAVGDILLNNGAVRATWTAFGWLLWHRNDTGVGQSLDRLGEYAMQDLQFLSRWIHPGDVVMDVGAYIGTHALMFARKVAPSGRVIAIEPNRQAYQMLCCNLMMNGITGVRTASVAAGAQPGQFKLPMLDDEKSFDRGMFSIPQLPKDAPNQTLVGVLPLDMVESQACHVLKISTPGSTLAVLSGARNMLQRTHPVCFVSVFSTQERDAVRTFFDDMGYAVFSFVSPWYRPDNILHEPENPFQNMLRHAVFALPENRRTDAEAFVTDHPYGLSLY